MSTECGIAFKEWAVICQALASGKQTLILRKGGIHEGRDGFRVAHREFWLFPTYLHQTDRMKLVDEAGLVLDATLLDRHETDSVPLQLLAEVTDVFEITDEVLLPKLKGMHWWSEQTLKERFHYRNPGLFLLVVRISKLPEIHALENSPHFAGCRSWVDLPAPISTAGLTPVLNELEFATMRAEIRSKVVE
ncbi:MAG: hypothetical protein JWM11_8069 [Planctomycetaceae bacterium]|nr:hypothetical protein [Planctomycetaceae bacterium]